MAGLANGEARPLIIEGRLMPGLGREPYGITYA
jgi:hypothetical protein